jgi:hypothetical protein
LGAGLWALRADLFWARTLLGVAAFGATDSLQPEIHYYLFDRYFRLSELHQERGHAHRAARLRRLADWHYERSGSDTPPPAVATALPAPRRPTLTWAVSGRRPPPDPPEAA